MKILITGAAGFIGSHLCLKLLELGHHIIGVDNLNNYYDIKLKKDRLKLIKNYAKNKKKKFQFIKADMSKIQMMKKIFSRNKFSIIFHLAAQAGVRFSIKNPDQYYQSNIKGFYNILDLSRQFKINHLFFASSSSVYGDSTDLPSKETSNTDRPISFYAATKKTNEVMAYAYSAIYKLPTTALRFFTVYGPYGRPDMSLYKFFNNIIKGKSINVFNHGKHERDFTYIDDVIKILVKIKDTIPKGDTPYQCFNIANSKPVKIIDYIKLISKVLKRDVKIKYLDLQKGDVKKTHASNRVIKKKVGKFKPTKLKEGLKKYHQWFLRYYC
jgi:UDP-glucuronate 4-epimerase